MEGTPRLPAQPSFDWKFAGRDPFLGWFPVADIEALRVERGALCFRSLSGESLAMTATGEMPVEGLFFVNLRARASRGGRGAVLWAADLCKGLAGRPFDVIGDGV